jgi:hypothetical protein
MEYQFESIGPTLRYVVLAFLLVFALLALGVVVILAALPGRIAKARAHPQAEAINICGWVGLPTGILWAVALVWAFLRPAGSSDSQGGDIALKQKLSKQVNDLERAVSALESNRKEKQG